MAKVKVGKAGKRKAVAQESADSKKQRNPTAPSPREEFVPLSQVPKNLVDREAKALDHTCNVIEDRIVERVQKKVSELDGEAAAAAASACAPVHTDCASSLEATATPIPVATAVVDCTNNQDGANDEELFPPPAYYEYFGLKVISIVETYSPYLIVHVVCRQTTSYLAQSAAPHALGCGSRNSTATTMVTAICLARVASIGLSATQASQDNCGGNFTLLRIFESTQGPHGCPRIGARVASCVALNNQ